MKRLALVLALFGSGCRHEAAPVASFPLRKVCSVESAKLESLLADADAPPEADEELRERVRSLVLDRAHAPSKMRAIELSDLVSIGPPAVPILDALLTETDRTPEERLSALEVLGAIDDPGAAEALAKRIDIERVREPWIRAQAAFQLAKQSSDHVLPALLAKLKYETDGETVIWIAATLAKHANFSGLDGLRVLSVSAATPEIQGNAQAMLAKVTQDAGFSDPEALHATWFSGDAERKLPREEPSPRLQLEMWRRIAALAEFDLRLVDDARFALVGSAAWIVEPLAAALHEEDAYVRLHVAQCLERMGVRARGACGELVLALDEPHTAAAAAAALGAIGCPDALDALVKRTEPAIDAELRTAAASALGHLGAAGAIPPLRALLAETEPLDLRQAAAQSLLALDDTAPALPVLIACLTTAGADTGAAESAIHAWLTRRAAANDPAALATLERWKAIAGDSGETPSPAEAARHRNERAELMRMFQL